MAAVVMTAEQMAQMMLENNTAMIKLFAAQMKEQSEAGSQITKDKDLKEKRGRDLDSKSFTRVDKFDGGELTWPDWKNDMEVILNSINGKFSQFMKKAEKLPGPTDFTNSPCEEEFKQRSNELLGILFVLVSGEAKALIKSQTDGIDAWKVLCSAYSSRTLARTLRLYQEAIVPKRANSIQEVIDRISE